MLIGSVVVYTQNASGRSGGLKHHSCILNWYSTDDMLGKLPSWYCISVQERAFKLTLMSIREGVCLRDWPTGLNPPANSMRDSE